MAGLVPQNAQAIAQILVQYIASTGACVIDLPAAAPALNICSSIEIRFKQEDVIEELVDAICIEPTLAPAPAPAPAEPHPSVFKQPPPAPGPWRTKGSPRVLGDVSEEDCDEDENSHVVTPPMPDDPPEPLPTRVPVQERPVITQSSASLTPTPTPSISRPPVVEKSSSVVSNSTSISVTSSHPSLSPSSSPSPTPLPSSSTPSSSRPPPKITPSSTPELPTLTLTRVISTPRPPPYSTSYSPPPAPTHTTTVRHPDPPKPPPPPPPPPTSPVPPPPPPPPTPDPCESAYTEIDVNKIESKPDSYDQYLHLVGIDLAQHHSKGPTEQEVKTTLIHQYRNRCGVDLPQGPAPVFPGVNGGQEQTEGYRRCLERCEREAILKAGDGLLHECLGVAYKSKPGAPNQGDCRFWSGDKDDNMLLPVHMFPDTSGSGNRWQVLYM
ncbi:hypothetical protein F4679DRAFT_594642 [Xylaria curta]|nr:hypothetical protein F4679DRAFT_594642 [Xylaria curta]